MIGAEIKDTENGLKDEKSQAFNGEVNTKIEITIQRTNFIIKYLP